MPEINKDEEPYYFNYFRKLYESWERSMSKAMEVWLKNPIFAHNAEKAIEKSIEFKGYIHEIMERTLKHRFIPTRHEMNKLVKSLDDLEVKLNKVEERINETKNTTRSAIKPKKRSLKKGGKKIESRKV